MQLWSDDHYSTAVLVYLLLLEMAEEAQVPDRHDAMLDFCEDMTAAQWQALARLANPGLHESRREISARHLPVLVPAMIRAKGDVGRNLREAMAQRKPKTLAEVWARLAPANLSPDGHRRYTDAEVAKHDCRSCGTSLPDCDASMPCCGSCHQTDTHRDPGAHDERAALGGMKYRARYRGRTANREPLRPCKHCDEPLASCRRGATAGMDEHARYCCDECKRSEDPANEHPDRLV